MQRKIPHTSYSQFLDEMVLITYLIQDVVFSTSVFLSMNLSLKIPRKGKKRRKHKVMRQGLSPLQLLLRWPGTILPAYLFRRTPAGAQFVRPFPSPARHPTL